MRVIKCLYMYVGPCMYAPALFTVAIDWILNHMTARPSINIGSSSFSDLVYADDTAFFVKDATVNNPRYRPFVPQSSAVQTG